MRPVYQIHALRLHLLQIFRFSDFRFFLSDLTNSPTKPKTRKNQKKTFFAFQEGEEWQESKE